MIRQALALALLWAAAAGAAPLDVLTDTRLGDARRATLERLATEAEDWLETATGRQIRGAYLLLGATRGSMDQVLTAAYARLDRPKPIIPANLEQLCGARFPNAIASPDFILVCWPKEGAGPTDDRILRSVLVHELVHQMQYDLSGSRTDRPGDGPRRLGPAWLVEGTAEVFELIYILGAVPDDGPDFFRLQNPARRSRLTLKDLRRHGTIRDRESYGTARFAASLLARAHGTNALMRYFAALGQGLGQDFAFRLAFGQRLDAFEQEFEGLRRDYGAARDWSGP